MTHVNVEVFSEQHDILGEGPLWLEEEQALCWIDIARKRLHTQKLGGQHQHWDLPGRPGFVERFADGDLILAFNEGVHRFEVTSGLSQLLRPVPLSPGVRFNEGKADPNGRLWFGSMQDNFGSQDEPLAIERSEGALFRLELGKPLAVLETGIGISNTLAWSPDATQMYFADSLLDQIFVYDYDRNAGDLKRKRLFFKGFDIGLPDGSAMDLDGCLWNTRWGAGMIVRITPDGRLDRCIPLPVPQPSSCAFGGPRNDVLFITSARNGLSAQALAAAPLSGSVLALSGLARGMPVPPVSWRPE